MRRVATGSAGAIARLGIAFAVIVLLIGLVAGFTAWRYERALDAQQRAAVTEQTLEALVEVQDAVLDRAALSLPEVRRATSEAARAPLRGMRERYEAAVRRTIHPGEDGTEHAAVAERLLRAGRAMDLIEDRDIFRSTPATEADLQRYREALVDVEQLVERYAAEEREHSAELQAMGDDARSEAQIVGIAGTILAVLLVAGLAAYAMRLVRALLDGVRQAASELSAASLEQHAAAREAAAGTVQQSATISEAATTVEELQAAANAIAAGANASAGAANETRDTMGDMQEQVSAIAGRAVALGGSTQQIGEIVELIESIAAKTNLLAINAAIEAAHAGDAGRGFAVVASEVRDLAQRTVSSTDSIRQIVESVQNDSHATILATERGSKQAETVVDLMRDAVQELERSLRASEDQKDAIAQFAETMVDLRAAATQFAAEQDRSVQRAERMQRLAAELEQLLLAHAGRSAVRHDGGPAAAA